VKGNTIKDFMSAEEHTKTITIIKPERRIDKGALDSMRAGGGDISIER
jgi:hypothetical protein